MTLKIIFNQKILIMLFIIAGSLFPQSSMEWMNQMALYEAVRLYEEEKENMNLTNNRTMLYELEKAFGIRKIFLRVGLMLRYPKKELKKLKMAVKN